jgi:hypothetical protein
MIGFPVNLYLLYMIMLKPAFSNNSSQLTNLTSINAGFGEFL